MSTIQTSSSIVHFDSSLNVSASKQYTATQESFAASSIAVTTADEVVATGEITTPKMVMLKHVSGSDVRIGLDGSTYPFRLTAGEAMMLRLDVEGLIETSTVTAIADVASAMSGDYFDLTDRTGTVRVWFNMAATAAFGSITYGTPAVAVAATGSITYGVPANTDTVIVNGTTFTKVASAPAANEFSTIAELEALVEAVTGVNSTENGTVVSITAATAGFAGNSITLALGGGNTGTMTVSGATLTGGLDSTSVIVNGNTFTYVASSPGANQFSTIAGLEVLVEAVALITSTSNGTIISIVADTAGTAGNSITLALGANTAGTTSVSGATLSGGTDASTPPATPGGGRLLPVVIVEDATANTNATAIAAAIDADAEFSASALAALVTILDAHTGTRTNIAAGTSGMTVATTQGGAASPVIHLLSVGTSQVVTVVAPS